MLAFGAANQQWHAWALFAVYGMFFGLTEGVEKALVADFAPAHLRGSAFGLYHLVVGLGALPASLLFGLVWQKAGPAAAFGMGALFALLAGILLALLCEEAGCSSSRLSQKSQGSQQRRLRCRSAPVLCAVST